MIVPLNLPKANLKLTRKNDQIFVWCILRKKDLVLTPEEWVRQHLVHYLINDCQFPIGRIAAEFKLDYNNRAKRADIVLFGKHGEPQLIVECKAPEVPISESTIFQIAQYKKEMKVEFLLLSNGIDHELIQVTNDRMVDRTKDMQEIISELS